MNAPNTPTYFDVRFIITGSFIVETYITINENTCCTLFWYYKKGKAIPVTGRGGPQGRETSRLPHFLDNRLTDGGEVASLTRRHPLPPGIFLILNSVRGRIDPRAIVRLEELCQFKNPITS
jgi:hypothetical protein